MSDPHPGGENESPAELPRLRYALYVEALRARMPGPAFTLLMEAVGLYVKAGGGRVRLRMDPEDRELFTAEVQQELLTLLGLLGAMQPGHADRADHVVVRLGDGEHAKGALSLVPPEVAADPERLRAMLEKIDARQRRIDDDRREVEEIARASGMPVGESGPSQE
ncbi:hypothetical protein GCM10010232_62940 [Streptomyces amakusaensis]|uniref:Uncharacterized protein n=1 Tax=Streptomyces amakusaensis TaxID=67271 RepID=A0ABW0AQM6_9ACTN